MAVNSLLQLTPLFFCLADGICILITVLLWYVYIHKSRYFNIIVIVYCLTAMLTSMMDFRNIQNGIRSLMFTGSGSVFSGTSALILSGMLLLLIFTLEFVSRNHSIMFLICCAVLIFSPLINISLSPASIVMILIFQFGFAVINPSGNSYKQVLTSKHASNAAALGSIIAAAAIFICFFPSLAAEKTFEDDILFNVYLADSYIQDMIAKFSDSFDSDISDGTVSRGNLRQTGKKMFTAEIVNPPENRLYLKSFTGCDYNGDQWSDAFTYVYYSDSITAPYKSFSQDNSKQTRRLYSDNRNNTQQTMFCREAFINPLIQQAKNNYFEKVRNIIEKASGYKLADCTFSDGYFSGLTEEGYNYTASADGRIRIDNLNSIYEDDVFLAEKLPEYPSLLFQSYENKDPVSSIYAWDVDDHTVTSGKGNTLNIAPEPDRSLTPLIPYYASRSMGGELLKYYYLTYAYFNYYKYTSTMESAYREPYTDPDTGRKQKISKAEKALEPYSYFIDMYYDKILDEYTYVPYENMPRLTELCADTELSDVNDVTTFILYTLQNYASYSTTPGTVPYNKDTIEYFLFDNHKGYCVHFATAAVMMYRMYGIPARYVSGYVVDESLFKPSGNNTGSITNAADYRFTADVTDRSAHAWCEIFLKDYGWVPVEVTPAANGMMYAQYPGYDYSVMTDIMKKYDWHFRNTASQDNNNTANGNSDKNDISLLLIICIILLSAAAFSAVFIPVRRIIILRRQEYAPCTSIFDKLIRCLHFSGLLKSLNGSEEHFAEVFSKAVPDISIDEAANVISIMNIYHYSPEDIGKEDSAFVLSIYKKTASCLYSKTPWYKKPVFRFIKAFI